MMNGRDIVLDTNIVLYFLSGDANVSKFFYEYNPIISFVTELEILSSPEILPNEKLFIRDFIKDITVIKYSDDHKEDIIRIRSKKKLKLPDAIIASLAVTLGLPLVTADAAMRSVEDVNLIFYSVLNQR